jgi:hypothetical protein
LVGFGIIAEQSARETAHISFPRHTGEGRCKDFVVKKGVRVKKNHKINTGKAMLVAYVIGPRKPNRTTPDHLDAGMLVPCLKVPG